jgi:hypothetical protein
VFFGHRSKRFPNLYDYNGVFVTLESQSSNSGAKPPLSYIEIYYIVLITPFTPFKVYVLVLITTFCRFFVPQLFVTVTSQVGKKRAEGVTTGAILHESLREKKGGYV